MNDTLFDIVEHTSRNIFLTGKAGTGKTTFLNSFVKKTRKKNIVVAPTGIAAINAGGVTIHSMFGLPLRTFVPTVDYVDRNYAMNIPDLLPHFKYRKDKLKLLREVEIIIVDEVSMLRADVLDMMDFALRHIRHNQQKFGGVQMLFIGDLYQLPPVVRDENEYILKQFYASPFFFEAKALQGENLITVELTEVFRQKDEHFLRILNAIRDGRHEDIDFDTLNERVDPTFDPSGEPYVYLSSHNRMVDKINRKKLDELPGQSYFYGAVVHGDFKENQFPNEENLELKLGAQVMFIRNDTSPDKKYYNGKLAEVTYLDEDEIEVKLDGSGAVFSLKREVWEQKKYSLGDDKVIKEEVLGSFEQFPIRLAWAVTIHKSQGLTFDRLIIDVGQSFASGQVYVALSRCRTLEGIVLKSKITPEVIFSDQRIGKFQGETNANGRLAEILQNEKYDYSIRKVIRNVDLTWISSALTKWFDSASQSKFLDREKASHLYTGLKPSVQNLENIFKKFEKILLQKTRRFTTGEENWEEVHEKAKGAVNFFFKAVFEQVLQPLKDFYSESKGVKGLKQYNTDFREFLDDLEEYLSNLKTVHLLEEKLFSEENDVDVHKAVKKLPTHIVTFQMFENGKSVNEIGRERGLVNSTIYGHLAKFAEKGLLDITRLFDKEKIRIFEETFRKEPQENLNDWKKVLPNDFEYHEIRILLNHLSYHAQDKSS